MTIAPGEVADTRAPLAFGPDPVLTDEPVTIRRWREPDVPAYQELHNDPSVIRWAGRAAGRTVDAERAWRDVCVVGVEDWLTGACAHLAICVDDVPVGDLSIRRIHERLASFGWSLQPAARGRGIATRAVRRALDWGDSQGFSRLEARVHAENRTSQALAERAGFRREGFLASDSPAGDSWGDSILYGWTRA